MLTVPVFVLRSMMVLIVLLKHAIRIAGNVVRVLMVHVLVILITLLVVVVNIKSAMLRTDFLLVYAEILLPYLTLSHIVIYQNVQMTAAIVVNVRQMVVFVILVILVPIAKSTNVLSIADPMVCATTELVLAEPAMLVQAVNGKATTTAKRFLLVLPQSLLHVRMDLVLFPLENVLSRVLVVPAAHPPLHGMPQNMNPQH